MTPPRSPAAAAAAREWRPALEDELRARTERRSGGQEPNACIRWLVTRDDSRRGASAWAQPDRSG
jgi:hypothetical protein